MNDISSIYLWYLYIRPLLRRKFVHKGMTGSTMYFAVFENVGEDRWRTRDSM